MSLGNSLFNARKKSGLSQEEVAEKLGSAGRPFPNGNWKFHIVKDTTSQTHAYITSRTLNFGGTPHEKTDFL